MKKIIYILCIFFVISIILNGCKKSETTIKEKEDVAKKNIKTMKIGTLKGPTGMGMSYMMEKDEKGESKLDYSFNIVGAPDQLTSDIINNKIDVAAVPTNLAAILYTKTKGNIQLLGVNTLGVLYLIENGNTIKNISDLKEKSVISSGKGAAPEYIFQYLIEKNGLDINNDVNIEYLTEHSEVAASIVSGKNKLAIIPEPFVTTVLSKNKDLRIALNFTEEWSKATSESELPMGVIIVSKKFADENSDSINTFMNEYTESVDFVNNNHNKASEFIKKFDILQDSNLASKAISNSSITFIESKESKDDILKFYEILNDLNPKTIGGSIPDDKFFYEK
ncbi:MAG: MqnA/MqnD/SBP family protein [Clostridiales bacterium]